MQNSNIDITISAKDQASGILGRIRGGLANLGTVGGSAGTGVANAITSIGASAMRIAAPLLALGGAVALIRKGFSELAADDSMVNQLKTISASAAEAKQRFDSIDAKRYDWSIFSVKQLVDAEVNLGRFTQGAWQGVEAHRVVGDVAAATGSSVEGVASQMGRAYSEIMSGHGGRGLHSLALGGIITPTDVRQLEEMNKAGKSGQEVWEKLISEVGKFGGAMTNMSNSAQGKMSALAVAWDDVKKSFVEPLMPAILECLIKKRLPIKMFYILMRQKLVLMRRL
jgi:hypothetical protein